MSSPEAGGLTIALGIINKLEDKLREINAIANSREYQLQCADALKRIKKLSELTRHPT